ncbi:hypothetical protein DDB_G0283629 [Dictyostelium discoideum AX4]|uniref:Probable zinc transporter protein DDB_G0283629 n=1 Tax=Dictyostelium discoideum TaxID=44689 RepID=Y3629_DICDI|nr:hypothetical protein DDB_G0283629 [Dictyostelium discoideum AX4]Q54QU8.1 RecName: Full=Probable zinc transporter protein DDB_G0283629 [Dictyostelium discoideum]EAL65581.1 hypothetical protein DDB_G0283629 [Dictyostelium discoideum AX4]|eukprot:XP_638925.1 hypothetical protein DDB_G0283629 [Dictyostelium discoideum AX4]
MENFKNNELESSPIINKNNSSHSINNEDNNYYSHNLEHNDNNNNDNNNTITNSHINNHDHKHNHEHEHKHKHNHDHNHDHDHNHEEEYGHGNELEHNNDQEHNVGNKNLLTNNNNQSKKKKHGHSHGGGEDGSSSGGGGGRHGHGHSHGGGSGSDHNHGSSDEDDEESKPLNQLRNLDSKKKARYSLILALTLTTIFMVGEIVGGYFANSLAIMTDAAHLLTDIGAMFLSLFAMWISQHPPTSSMSFGFHRAEILGALVSVLMIWALTGVLVYEAIQRILYPPDAVDGKIMFIIASCGLFINIIDAIILHWGSGGHGHSHGGGHGHSHGIGGGTQKKKSKKNRLLNNQGQDIEDLGGENGKNKKGVRNINVHSAYIHVLGDCFQSIGVMVASCIIWVHPHWKIADPITTLIFSVIVLGTTIKLLRESLGVLMEGVPPEIDVSEVKGDLSEIEGVTEVHDLHIWSITLGRPALSVHLTILPTIDPEEILSIANKILLEDYEINHTTIQIEKPLVKDKCKDHSCPPPKPKKKKIKNDNLSSPPNQ